MKYIKSYNNFLNETIKFTTSYNSIFKTPEELDTEYISDFNKHTEVVENGDSPHIQYQICKTEDNEYFMIKHGEQLFDVDDEIYYWNSDDGKNDYPNDFRNCLKALNSLIKKFLDKWQSYDFQKKLLDEHPERVGELTAIGYHKDLVKDPNYAWIFDQESNGFFGLKLYENQQYDYNLMFIDPSELNKYELFEDDIKNKSEFIEIGDAYNDEINVSYEIWKYEDGRYFITKNEDLIVNVKDEKEELSKIIYGDFDGEDTEGVVSVYQAELTLEILEFVDDFIKKIQSYNYQKKLLDEHPEKVRELKPFGYNKDLINDPKYQWIFDQETSGFFNIKNNK